MRTHGQSPKSRFRNYWLWCSSDALSKSFRIAAGMMSMLATLSPFFNLMATEPLVFLPTARTWVHSSHRSKGEDWDYECQSSECNLKKDCYIMKLDPEYYKRKLTGIEPKIISNRDALKLILPHLYLNKKTN